MELSCCLFCKLFSLQPLLIKLCHFENIKSQVWLRVTSQLLKSYWYSCAPIMPSYKFGLHFPTKISAIPCTCGLSLCDAREHYTMHQKLIYTQITIIIMVDVSTIYPSCHCYTCHRQDPWLPILVLMDVASMPNPK
jgi:hypothetical protein